MQHYASKSTQLIQMVILLLYSSIRVGLVTNASRNKNQCIESNMSTSNEGHDLSTLDDPVKRSVTPQRVSQHSQPWEGSVTS